MKIFHNPLFQIHNIAINAQYLRGDVSVEVGSHTRLKGGYIAGGLTTGSLSWVDLEGYDRGRQVSSL